jgi:hypothetical protein
VTGLDGIILNDLMDNIEWFFNLHDQNKDGFLTKDEVLTVSESLLVCKSRHRKTRILVLNSFSSSSGMKSATRTSALSVASCPTRSNTVTPSYPDPKGADEDAPTPPVETNQPYLSLATFRMVVLADEVLESFFETDLSASFRLEPVPLMELPPSNSGFLGLGGLWSNIATDNNVKLFHKLSDEVGKTIGRHQVIHRPSIGRYTSIEDTRPRESLLTPAMRSSSSSSGTSPAAEASHPVERRLTDSHDGGVPRRRSHARTGFPCHRTRYPQAASTRLAQATIAANALMERTPFAIDDAGDEDDDDDDDESDEDEEETEYEDDVWMRCVFVIIFCFGGDAL